LVDPSKLKEHSKNRNKHGQDQIERLSELFKYHGIRHPIICDADNKKTIIAGRGRQLAAIRKGIKEYPVVYQKFDSEEQKYAFIQADNSIALWAELDLHSINVDLADLGPDFNIDMLGIKNFTLDMAEKEGLTDEDEVPEHVEPKTKLGDIYQLGDHRLMCGDSTSIDAVDKLMCGEKADMVFTSPPYNFGKAGFEKRGKYEAAHDSDENEWLDLMRGFMATWQTVSEYQFVNLQILAGNKVKIHEWLYIYKDRFVDQLALVKSSLPAMEKNILNAEFECLYIFRSIENPKKHIHLGKEFRGNISNVFQMKRSKGEFAGVHRAAFDVSFPEYFIDTLTSYDKSIADPFGGTGTTLIACEKTNRKCFMMELDPHYCDVVVKRWENFTGKKAEMLKT
jgi:DNA modification methylase